MHRYSVLICLLVLSSVLALPSKTRHIGRTASRLRDIHNPLIAGRQVKANDIRSGTPTRRQNQCANPGPSGCPCPAGQMMCGSGCTDVTADPNNCGACGTTCSDIEYCTNSVCTECPFGDISCDNACVVGNSATVCGACDVTCPSYLYCYAPPGGDGPWGFDYSCGCPYDGTALTDCSAVCVDLTSDPNNCGSCGTSCSDIEYCTNSVCTECPFGDISCDNACVVGNSATVCGACDVTCPSYLYCYAPPGGDGPWGFDYSCGCPYDGTVLTDCNGACVDLQTDTNNCDACGAACPSGGQCNGGTCSCPSGQSVCNDACVPTSDFQTDSSNCGMCRTVCSGSTPDCIGGVCGSCSSGETYCYGSCTITDLDPSNCGTCGNECFGSTPDCIAGVCGSCPAGEMYCSGLCTSTDVDPSNCGTCGNECSGSAPDCILGVCGSCSPSETYCGGICISFSDFETDDQNCGGCGTVCSGLTPDCILAVCGSCSSGETYCFGSCTITDIDPSNCGTCGNECFGSNPYCLSGVCGSCSSGETYCNGVCVSLSDFEADDQNCGACGVVCSGLTPDCIGGVCGSCSSGETYCFGSCTNTDIDSSNCGTCGTECFGSNPYCIDGVCGSCPSGEAYCDGSCINTDIDTSNCGACGTVCEPGMTCSGGICGCYAPGLPNYCAPEEACTNIQLDSSNCGTCGNRCFGSNPQCIGGVCGSCPPGESYCSGMCVQPSFFSGNDQNCGSCGVVCPSDAVCAGGTCFLQTTGIVQVVLNPYESGGIVQECYIGDVSASGEQCVAKSDAAQFLAYVGLPGLQNIVTTQGGLLIIVLIEELGPTVTGTNHNLGTPCVENLPETPLGSPANGQDFPGWYYESYIWTVAPNGQLSAIWVNSATDTETMQLGMDAFLSIPAELTAIDDKDSFYAANTNGFNAIYTFQAQ